MTRKKNIKFQTIKVNYPNKLYAGALWMKRDRFVPFFLYSMQKDFSSLKKYAIEAIEKIREMSGEKSRVIDTMLVIPVSFVKNYPLKKNMWDSPKVELQYDFRFVEYINAINKPDFYNMMVTPMFVKSKKGKIFGYNAAFTFLKTNEEAVDSLTQMSDLYVNPEAKNAGIYSIEQVYGYDLENDEVVSKENSFIN